MKNTYRRSIPLAALVAVLAATAMPGYAQQPPSAAAEVKPPSKEQGSYLMGLQFTEQLRQVGITPDVAADSLAQGLKDGLGGKQMTAQDRDNFKSFVSGLMTAAVDRNVTAAKDFLARNGKEKGVKTTPSGLQYRILAAGDAKAASPAPNDEVTVNYRGKLLDGTEFDSSFARNAPATMRANGVIKGWQEALAMMKPGARWQLWVPPELAYDRTPRPGLPGGSLLDFEVELLSIKAAEAPKP